MRCHFSLSSHSLHVINDVHYSGLLLTYSRKPGKSGNLKETSESQGICLKSQGICNKIPKVREKLGEFCCLKFIFSQLEDPNFENFQGEHAPRPPKWCETHGRA